MKGEVLLSSLGYFSGINNLDDPVSLAYSTSKTPDGYKAVYPLQKAENVWIDNTSHINSRTEGMTQRVSGAVYNAWSDKDIFLYMIADTLYSLSTSYASTLLASGLSPNLPMSYARFNDRVYYSNGINIGYIKGNVAYSLSTPTIEYKQPLPPGQHLAVFMGCLYSARNNVLYIADPLSDCFDVRKGYRQFKDDLTMVRPVDNGIYISDTKTYFMAGLSPEEFIRTIVEDAQVIPYTDINIDGIKMGEGNKPGQWAIWTSSEGIVIGNPDGHVDNVTKDRLSMVQHTQGTAFMHEVNGVQLYINSMRQ